MKYLNGQLPNKLDETLCLYVFARQRNMNWAEYVPIVLLCLLSAALLLVAWVG